MALVLGKKNTRKIKVIAEQLGDFDTVIGRHSFDIEFKIMPNADWMDAVNSDAIIADLARDNMVGVDGVKDENDAPIPYSEALKEALFNETWLVKYINEAFIAVQGGTKQTDLYKKGKAKKLTDAGYFWFSQGSRHESTEALEDDAAAFGLILPALPDEPDEEFVLWWDSQTAWQVFMDLSSPWKFSMDGIVGIDDLAIIAVIKLAPIKRIERIEILRDVQALLRGGLMYIDEQREKRSKK